MFVFVWPAWAATISYSALPGDTGSTLSNLDLAIVCILGACANYFEAFNALKYSSSATFAGLPLPV